MKRILTFILFSFALAASVKSQTVTRKSPAKDSVVDGTTKYITFNSSPSLTGLSLVGVKASGTVSGYAIVQVRIDTIPTSATSDWDDYVYPGTTKSDTLFFTNVSTPQAYQWPVPTKFFNGFRFKIVTTGTQKLYLYAAYLKP